jgi:protein-S-isoprenylcysteine O-methyltransferase Ste14
MQILLAVTGLAWLLLEVRLIARDRARGLGGTDEDRGTRRLNFILLVASVVAADVLGAVTGKHSPLWIPGAGPSGWPIITGLVVIWIGLAVRVWAVATLGRSFRTTVEVDAGQTVVSNGPYRWVRHPSYTGLMLIVVGFGLAFGTWPGLAVCVLVPAVAMLRRIHVEEAELTRVLGDEYRAYSGRTKRLIPGLW